MRVPHPSNTARYAACRSTRRRYYYGHDTIALLMLLLNTMGHHGNGVVSIPLHEAEGCGRIMPTSNHARSSGCCVNQWPARNSQLSKARSELLASQAADTKPVTLANGCCAPTASDC